MELNATTYTFHTRQHGVYGSPSPVAIKYSKRTELIMHEIGTESRRISSIVSGQSHLCTKSVVHALGTSKGRARAKAGQGLGYGMVWSALPLSLPYPCLCPVRALPLINSVHLLYLIRESSRSLALSGLESEKKYPLLLVAAVHVYTVLHSKKNEDCTVHVSSRTRGETNGTRTER